MGNVNGREDGAGSNSPSTGEETASVQESMASQDATHPRYHGHADADGQFMGHSPPPSPRASHSPLMFRPQVFNFL